MTDAEKVLLCSKVEEAMFLNWPETDVEAVRSALYQMAEEELARYLQHESDRLAEEIERQRATFAEEMEKSMVEEKYKDPAEVENRAYMKEQQRLARRCQSRFRKKY